MKRKHPTSSTLSSGNKHRALEAPRLSAVRGGGDLGIAIRGPIAVPAIMQIQHNELLITQ